MLSAASFLDVAHAARVCDYAFATLGLCASYVVLLIIYRLYFHPLSKLPGPRFNAVTELPLLFAIFGMRRCPTTHKLFERFGPIVRIAPNTVAINDYQVIPEIYGIRTKYRKSQWYSAWRLYNEGGLFSYRDNDKSMRRRRVMVPIFSNKSLEALQGKIHEVATDMISYVQTHGCNGAKPVDFLKAYRNLSLDMLGQFAMNYDFALIKSGEQHPFVQDLDAMSLNGMLKAYLPQWSYLLLKTLPIASVQFIVQSDDRGAQYAIQAIDEIEARPKSGEDQIQTSFISRLAESVDTETGQRLTKSQLIGETQLREFESMRQAIRTEVFIVELFGGTDTTSATLTFLTYELARRPDIAEKLFSEINVVMPNRFSIPDKKVLDALPYLTSFIKEGLRRYCAAPSLLERVVPEGGAVYLGYHIPAGTTVGVQSYSFHQRPDIFANPLGFNPDRWLNPTEEMERHFFPFGIGSRKCAGLDLAMMELRTTLCTMSRNFTFHVAPATTPESMQVADMWIAVPVGHKCDLYAHIRDA